MVKKLYFYFFTFFTFFVVLTIFGNFKLYKHIRQTISSVTTSYQYNFFIYNTLENKINLIKKLTDNYYKYLKEISLKEKISHTQTDVFKVLSILKTLKKLQFKKFKPFLFEYFSYQFKNDIEIIKNSKIIVSKHVKKLGKTVTLPCDPITNSGSCSVIKNGKYYYLVYSPYYKMIIETDVDLDIDYSPVKQKIIEILKKIPNIIIYSDGKKITGNFEKDSFYIFDEFKPLNIFFGFGIKYKEIESISKTINSEIKKAVLPHIYTYLILFFIIISIFYTILFVLYKKKITLVHNIFTEYKEKATVDKLTGIYNRAGFEHKIQDQKCSYFIITDLDNFKYINDTFGHDKGDEILKEFAWLLKKYFKNDIIGRWGGDEFLICTDKNKKQITEIIQTINEHLQEAQKQFDKTLTKQVSVSAGCCCDNSLDLQKRFANADLALYKVKKSKKGNVLFYKDIDYIKIEKEDISKENR